MITVNSRKIKGVYKIMNIILFQQLSGNLVINALYYKMENWPRQQYGSWIIMKILRWSPLVTYLMNTMVMWVAKFSREGYKNTVMSLFQKKIIVFYQLMLWGVFIWFYQILSDFILFDLIWADLNQIIQGNE